MQEYDILDYTQSFGQEIRCLILYTNSVIVTVDMVLCKTNNRHFCLHSSRYAQLYESKCNHVTVLIITSVSLLTDYRIFSFLSWLYFILTKTQSTCTKRH